MEARRRNRNGNVATSSIESSNPKSLQRKGKEGKSTHQTIVVAMLFVGLLLSVCHVSTDQQVDEYNSVRVHPNHPFRKQPIEIPDPPAEVGSCRNLIYTSSPTTHRPVWVASYPGSGSEMLRELVQTLTGGLVGGSVYLRRDPPYVDCVVAKAATCKTHWPVLPLHSPFDVVDHYHSNTILLVRNPTAAFASRLNHLWEIKAGIGAHTKQAPEFSWNQWIQKNWKQQIEKYEELIRTWTNASFPYDMGLLLAYEDLIDTHVEDGSSYSVGALTTQRLVKILEDAKVRVVQGDDSIDCLWRHTVVEAKKRKRAEHTYIPGYTAQQKDWILSMVQERLLKPLLDKQTNGGTTPVDTDMIRVLTRYEAMIQNSTRVVSDQD